MSDSALYNVILAPHVSEKSTQLAEGARQIVFKVSIDASKPQIRRAIEKLFSVEVESVKVVRQKGILVAFPVNVRTGKRPISD